VLGDRRQVNAIRELNPGVDPKRMRPGIELKLPAAGAPQAAAAQPAGTGGGKWREYTVVKGDSASEISRKMYGTTRHAAKILEANAITDPTKMQLNTVLRIPPLE
jgi:nucleoid-associated protein YgaU